MKRKQKLVLSLVALATLGIMTASYARSMDVRPDGGCGMVGMEGNKMGNTVQMDNRLAKLKKNLSISAEQEAAWSAFTSTIARQKTEMISVMQERMQLASSAQETQSAPERIGAHTRLMKQRLAVMETMAAAMQQLYPVLTPQQKQFLDARFAKDMPM